MDLLNTTNPTLLPGQRLLKTKGGYEAAEKYPMPRDCETVIFDEDEDYFYIKKTDTNGGVIFLRYRYEEDPIPKFDPKKYVTVDDFNSLKEEMLNGFNSIQQAITASSPNTSTGYVKQQSGGSSKQNGRTNNVIDGSSANV